MNMKTDTNTVEYRIAQGTAGGAEFRVWMIQHGCAASLIDSVERKNRANAPQIAARKAALAAERRAANRGRAAQPHSVTVTQAQIDEMVESRDLNLYPLSAFEKLERAANERRRQVLNTILSL